MTLNTKIQKMLLVAVASAALYNCTTEPPIEPTSCTLEVGCKNGRECWEGTCIDKNAPKPYTCKNGIKMLREYCSPPPENCQTKYCQDLWEKEVKDLEQKCIANNMKTPEYFNCMKQFCSKDVKNQTLNCDQYLN